MNSIESTILSKVGKNNSKEILPGIYHFKGSFDVDCKFKKGEDYEKTNTPSIPLKIALSLFIQRCGMSGEKACKLLVQCMKDAFDGIVPDVKVTTAAEQKVKSILNELPKKICTGSLRMLEKNVMVNSSVCDYESEM